MARRSSGNASERIVERFVEPLAAPGLALIVIIAWQLAVPALGLSEFVLPTPSQIIARMAKDYALLLKHASVTLLEVLGGFTIAVAAGIPTALLIFYSRIFERAVYPLLIAEQAIPKVALAPLVVLYLGYGWAPKIFLAFLIGYFPIVVSTVVGLQSLDPAMVNLVRSMGATRWQTFIKIRLPAAPRTAGCGSSCRTSSRAPRPPGRSTPRSPSRPAPRRARSKACPPPRRRARRWR